MEYTSIQIMPETRRSLAELKASPRETYDEILRKLLQLVPQGDDEGEYTQTFRIGLLNARLDLKSGRIVSHKELKQRLGLR